MLTPLRLPKKKYNTWNMSSNMADLLSYQVFEGKPEPITQSLWWAIVDKVRAPVLNVVLEHIREEV